jgi:hypothetical protein
MRTVVLVHLSCNRSGRVLHLDVLEVVHLRLLQKLELVFAQV